MKDFFKLINKLFWFFTPLILWFIFLNVIFGMLPNSYQTKKDFFQKNINDWQILIMGSSHTYRGINPQFLSEKSFNFANSGQDLYYDTALARKYLNKMKNLKLVIFNISYHSLEYRQLDSENEGWRVLFYQKYYQIPKEKKSLFLKKEQYAALYYHELKTIRQIIFKNPEVLAENKIENNGYIIGLPKEVKNPQDAGKVAKVRDQSLMNPNVYKENFENLDKTIKILKQYHKKVLLISIPILPSYFESLDSQKYQKMQDALEKLSKENQVPYVNFLADPRFKNQDFSDADHLNSLGAEKFSQIINQKIHDLFPEIVSLY